MQKRKKKEDQTSLIGKNIKVLNSKNKDNLHIEGKVIDETKHTIYVQTNFGRKRLIKNNQEVMIK